MSERRHSSRDEAFLIGEIKGETIYIGDMSETGIKAASSKKIGEENDRVSIHVSCPTNVMSEITIDATIVWVSEKTGIFFFGLEFIDYESIKDKIKTIRELNDFISAMRTNLLS
ncbi:MAG TPA: hypothetical protein DHW82_02655 [Spirochaetia bacterium]|nr:MAG: hypothetical protein A2Y41_10525 [Spirochaetes bacterium GWB1_36_13]HCL55892.1 hypothetical protein [Spirochaetia bacterium]